MTDLVKLHFTVLCCSDGNTKELGENLAVWLQESWFNGEEVLEVEFIDYEKEERQ